jgi:hypothetical protein
MEGEQRQVVALRIAAQYLSAREACRPLLLNRFFFQHYLNDTFKTTISELIAANIPQDLVLLKELSFSQMLYLHPGFTNLVQNPCGLQGFEHWTKNNGGNGWAIEDWPEYRGNKSAFVSSYGWCSLTQTIHLKQPTSRKTLLIAGAVMCGRIDCGSVGEVRVKFSSTQLSTDQVRTLEEGRLGSWSFFPTRIAVCSEVPAGTREMQLEVRGKDTKFWQGNYGARFLHVFLHVLPIPSELNPMEVCKANPTVITG